MGNTKLGKKKKLRKPFQSYITKEKIKKKPNKKPQTTKLNMSKGNRAKGKVD